LAFFSFLLFFFFEPSASIAAAPSSAATSPAPKRASRTPASPPALPSRYDRYSSSSSGSPVSSAPPFLTKTSPSSSSLTAPPKALSVSSRSRACSAACEYGVGSSGPAAALLPAAERSARRWKSDRFIAFSFLGRLSDGRPVDEPDAC